MKDNFSQQARGYAQFRPHYPTALYDFVLSLVAERQTAWDCATGNGQVAGALADHFARVYATDISEKQLQHAVAKPNLSYQVAKAEQTPFPDQTFDLITVAQAIHWFDLLTVNKKGQAPEVPGKYPLHQTSNRINTPARPGPP